MDPVNIPAKFEVRSFTSSWDNRGYSKNFSRHWLRPRSIFSKMFHGLVFGWTLWMYRANLQSVALAVLEIIAIAVLRWGCEPAIGFKSRAFDCWRRTFEGKSHAIAGRTARCRCRFRYVSNFTTASCGFSATARTSWWSLSADRSELSVKKWQVVERTSQIA